MKIIFFGSGGDLSPVLSNQGFELKEILTLEDIYSSHSDSILDADCRYVGTNFRSRILPVDIAAHVYG